MDVYSKVTTHEFTPNQETLRQNFYESFPTDRYKRYAPNIREQTISAILSDAFTRNFKFLAEPDYNIEKVTMTVRRQLTEFKHKHEYQFFIDISTICDDNKSISRKISTPVFTTKCGNIKINNGNLDEECRNAAFDMRKEIKTLENPNLSDLETNKEDDEEELN